MIKSTTLAREVEFSYEGSIFQGTAIYFGKGYKIFIKKESYTLLIDHFKGMKVKIGTSRTTSPSGSMGDWLKKNLTKIAVAYIVPILVHEGYVRKSGKG